MSVAAKGKTKTRSRTNSKRAQTRPAKSSAKKVRTASVISKPSRFMQRIAGLTVHQATKMLGENGKKLLAIGEHFEIDSEQDVTLAENYFEVRIKDGNELATVRIEQLPSRSRELGIRCDRCDHACEHMGAALVHLMDAKATLGLSAPPDDSVALENLTDEELLQRALADRVQRSKTERMTVRSNTPSQPWTDYVVTSLESGRTYRVAIRGLAAGESYCTCPDFRTNRLGTCKHILHVTDKLKRKFSKALLEQKYVRKNLSIRVHYGEPHGLAFNLPPKLDPKLKKIVDGPDTIIQDGVEMMKRIEALERAGCNVHIYPDAEELIQRALIQAHLAKLSQEIRKAPDQHPLRKELLKADLLPYQLDGIAFVAGAGRAILADDMGLGKTIQGIGVAELLAREANIRRVLIVCPASLKSQWQSEINRFCNRDSQMVMGSGSERSSQYDKDVFFTICNYEQVNRDLTFVEKQPWDLIILDEGQRIKNWESKTSQIIRSLKSTFALVLSGTPLENRLDELYTVVKFVDDTRLGPAYRFFHTHREVDDRGKPTGYKNLDELRQRLRPILLRRTRNSVAKQLPERTDQVIFIEPTEEQLDVSNSQLSVAARIAAKPYLTEMDLLRLQKALLLARMSADSTYLIDQKEPEFSSKLERLTELFEELLSDPNRKIVLFSEWRRMLDRIEMKLNALQANYVRLDGSIPQKHRPSIVSKFQNDPECQLILMTNAGSTGLNLQSANTVINVDLPWNPAVLEQRIARAHRMGQKNPVHVYKLVTEGTIEERLLDTLASKQDLADAALDFESDTDSVTMTSSIANIRDKLEKILVPVETAPIDESSRRRVEQDAMAIQQQRERVSSAGGQLLGAALQLVGELVKRPGQPEPDSQTVHQLTASLTQCVQRDSEGRPQLTISLENDQALVSLAQTLAQLLIPGGVPK